MFDGPGLAVNGADVLLDCCNESCCFRYLLWFRFDYEFQLFTKPGNINRWIIYHVLVVTGKGFFTDIF